MMLRCLYSFLLMMLSPLFLYSLYKSKPNKPKFGKRWIEHFGFTAALSKSAPVTVWFHTVSVGEAIAATPLIKRYHAQYPEHAIVVTTTTATGAEQVEKIGEMVEHRYMPVDFSWTIRRFIRIINPQKLFIMETELWPNTLAVAAQHNIPISILNARLSARSAQRYQKFQAIFDLLCENLNQVLCQTTEDAQRFSDLGLPDEKIHITGSLKFDIVLSPQVIRSGETLRENIGHDRPVWVVASTHQGEDEIVLSAQKKLLQEYPDLLLILVPRHPERFDQVYQLTLQQAFKAQRRTAQEAINTDTQVYLADTMGEMLTFIGAADVCFMGGSLLGDKVGGHNLLEPAALAKPCLSGPSYYNFKQITEQLLAVQACSICDDSDAIYRAVTLLINDKQAQKTAGDAALGIVNDNKGALQKTLDYL